MEHYWIIVLAVSPLLLADAQPSTESNQPTPGYRFRYFVRDDKTKDIKGQTEVRQGDNVQGSYALEEPNGNMRVVTYTAGKGTGFMARVQVHPANPPRPPLPTNEPSLPHLMEVPPRNIYRPGFPQIPLEIKVVPPSRTTPAPQVTQKPPYTPEEEEKMEKEKLNSAGYSEQNYERFNSPEDASKGESGTTTIHHVKESTEASMTSKAFDSDEKNEEEEGRSRIKQNSDRVQLEMEQVIRTEMKDAEGVKMGTPYRKTSHTTPKPSPPKPEFLPRPNNLRVSLPYSRFRPDLMTPVYMKPLYMVQPTGPNAPKWPPVVSSGDRLYIPHIIFDENQPPQLYPSKVYLVPLPRPITMGPEDLMSLAYPWDGKTPFPKEDLVGSYQEVHQKPSLGVELSAGCVVFELSAENRNKFKTCEIFQLPKDKLTTWDGANWVSISSCPFKRITTISSLSQFFISW